MACWAGRMAADGPKRRAPPKRVKDAVRKRQKGRCGCRTGECGRPELPPDGKGLVHYQHDPALGVRPINEDRTDWIPPQHDPDYLYAEMAACHHRETNEGRFGAHKIGSDRYEIEKVKKRERAPRPKAQWGAGRKLQGRGFSKQHKPMRRKP